MLGERGGKDKGATFSGWLGDVLSEGSSEQVAPPWGPCEPHGPPALGTVPLSALGPTTEEKLEGAGVPRSSGMQETWEHRG